MGVVQIENWHAWFLEYVDYNVVIFENGSCLTTANQPAEEDFIDKEIFDLGLNEAVYLSSPEFIGVTFLGDPFYHFVRDF